MLGFGLQRALTQIPHIIVHLKVHHIIYLIGTEGDTVKVLAWPAAVLKTKPVKIIIWKLVQLS